MVFTSKLKDPVEVLQIHNAAAARPCFISYDSFNKLGAKAPRLDLLLSVQMEL